MLPEREVLSKQGICLMAIWADGYFEQLPYACGIDLQSAI